MKYPLFPPRWLFKYNIKATEWRETINSTFLEVNSCLSCRNVYMVNDPLDVCKPDFCWLIYNTYFRFSEVLYLASARWEISWWERQRVSDAYIIAQKWIERFKRDVANKQYLYELFQDVYLRMCPWSRFYTEKEFYSYLQNFFQFYIDYWESVTESLWETYAANDDENFWDKRADMHMLLDGLRREDSPFYPWDQYWELEPWEIPPYQKSFIWKWKTTLLRKNANMSEERLSELQALSQIMRVREEKKYSENRQEAERILAVWIAGGRDWPPPNEILSLYDIPF